MRRLKQQRKKVQRIIPFEGKAKENKETLATLFGERMLGTMPSDEVGIAPAEPPKPRLSAYRQAGRGMQMSWPTRAGWHTPDGASSCGTRRRQRAGH